MEFFLNDIIVEEFKTDNLGSNSQDFSFEGCNGGPCDACDY